VGVTSAASALQRRQLIRYSRGDISILDSRGLERAACPCYAIDRKIYKQILVRKQPPAPAGLSALLLASQIVTAISC
jgi:hypothetical protein